MSRIAASPFHGYGMDKAPRHLGSPVASGVMKYMHGVEVATYFIATKQLEFSRQPLTDVGHQLVGG